MGSVRKFYSVGTIDLGILVDASIVVIENVYRRISRRVEGENVSELIMEGVTEAARPVLFATIIILVAFLPLFTGRPRKDIRTHVHHLWACAHRRTDFRAGICAGARFVLCTKAAKEREDRYLVEPLFPQALRHGSAAGAPVQ